MTKDERRTKFLVEHPDFEKPVKVLRFPQKAHYGHKTGKWKKWQQLTTADILWRRMQPKLPIRVCIEPRRFLRTDDL